jgi:hypothetical protein
VARSGRLSVKVQSTAGRLSKVPDSNFSPDPLDRWFQERAQALGRFYRTEPIPLDPLEPFEADPESERAEPSFDADAEGWRKLCSLEEQAVAAELGVRDEPLVRFSDVVLDADWTEVERLFQAEMKRTPFA